MTESNIIRRLVQEATSHGYCPTEVDTLGDDDEGIEPATNETTVVEHATSVEEARIHFKTSDGRTLSVFYVGGNDIDCLADYSASEDGDKIMGAVYKAIGAI